MPAVTPDSRRAVRTAVSRERILQAAVEVLVELGYSAASTLEIQRRAGVSRGRLTHHFPSRELLLVAAVRHLVATRLTQLIDAQTKDGLAPEDSDTRIDQAIDVLWKTFHQPYFWASTELWLASRNSPELAQTLLPIERQLYASIRLTMDDLFGAHFAQQPHYRALRSLLFTSMRGVALTYSFDPRDPTRDPHVGEWREAARRMLGVETREPRPTKRKVTSTRRPRRRSPSRG